MSKKLHGNTITELTLYHNDGRTAHGTYADLEIQTGLEYNRIRDLVKGRRRISSLWSASEKEAKRGNLKRGRKRKAVQMSTEGTPLF